MSYVVPPGGGLSTVSTDATLTGDGTGSDPLSVVDPFTGVSTDATLTGDGTALDPLSVVPSPASLTDNISAYRTADSALLSTPITIVLDTQTQYTQDPAFVGTSAAFNGVAFGGIEYTVPGTYQITVSVSYETLPAGSKTDLQTELQIADAPAFGTTLCRTLGGHHLETADIISSSLSITKTFVIGAPTFHYLIFDAQSPVALDFVLKGDATQYAYVDVLRIA